MFSHTRNLSLALAWLAAALALALCVALRAQEPDETISSSYSTSAVEGWASWQVNVWERLPGTACWQGEAYWRHDWWIDRMALAGELWTSDGDWETHGRYTRIVRWPWQPAVWTIALPWGYVLTITPRPVAAGEPVLAFDTCPPHWDRAVGWKYTVSLTKCVP